ncbi:MAG TPA: hypothetical protein VH134_04720, partial [Candidatus Dormibacteraeota bacterium]|nr:hypothetical protein [Candidatus Dormibacteraeota bacterium]
QPGGTTTIGYLVTATIAGTTLTPDISVTDRQSGAATSVVGVVSTDNWSGGTVDPITMTAYISTANRQRIQGTLQRALPTRAVTFDFANHNWDAVNKRYFVSFAPASPPLHGQLSMNSTSRQPDLSVASTPGPVQTPQNWAMRMSVDPQPGSAQTIRVAASSSSSAVRMWGTQAAA